jgi:hypothetical protein
VTTPTGNGDDAADLLERTDQANQATILAVVAMTGRNVQRAPGRLLLRARVLPGGRNAAGRRAAPLRIACASGLLSCE